MLIRSLLLSAVGGCTQTGDPVGPVASPLTPGSEPGPIVDSGSPPDRPPTDDFLFAEGSVTELRLELDRVVIRSLRDDPDLYVPGTLIHGEERYEPIGVKLKGNGSFQPIDQKPSFKLRFDEYDPELEFYGLDRLVLNNMTNDPTSMHERVAHRLYREAGIPDVRAGHGWVLVNGEEYGLYSVVENIDHDLLERWYEDPDGSMWEMFDVDFLPEDVERFEHEEGPDDRTALTAISEILSAPEEGDWTALERWVDPESFLRYFAVSAVLGQYDAYPYSFPGDDLHLYLDPGDGRLDFIPHGTDETFEDPFRPIDYLYGRLAVACLDDPGCRVRWAAEVWEIQDLSESLDQIGYAERIRSEIGGFMDRDARRPFGRRQVERGTERMFEFMETRPERIAESVGARGPAAP